MEEAGDHQGPRDELQGRRAVGGTCSRGPSALLPSIDGGSPLRCSVTSSVSGMDQGD